MIRFHPYAISGLLIFLTSISLGIFVLSRNASSKLYRIWFAYCMFVGLWGLTGALASSAQDADAASFLWRLAFTASITWIPSLFFHFVHEFRGIRRHGWLYASYALSASWCLIHWTDAFLGDTRFVFGQFYYSIAGPLAYVHFAWWVFTYIFGFWLLVKDFRRESDHTRTQIKYMCIASGIGGAAGCFNFLLLFEVDIYPWANFAIPLFPLTISYAIIKHRLLDIRVAIKRTIFYSGLAFGASLVYVAAIFVSHQLMTGTLDTSGQGFRAYSIPPLIGACAFASLGIFVWLRKPLTGSKRLFVLLCFETFWWQCLWFISFFMKPETPELTLVAKLVYLLITFIPVTYYHLLVSFVGQKNEKNYIVALYSISAALCLLLPTDLYVAGNRSFWWGNFTLPGPLFPAFIALALATMLRGLWVLQRRVEAGRTDASLRNQTRYLYLACALYFFCTLDFFQVYGLPWYPVGTFFFLASFMVLAYAITRHQLLDIRIVIKRTLVYSAFAFMVSISYLLFVFVMHNVLLKHTSTGASFAWSFIAILVIAVSLKPFEAAFHRVLQKMFFKGTIQEISEQKDKLQSELERAERLKSLGILAAGMAHEIKNPITAIKTFSEYLPQKKDDPEFLAKFSRIMQKETARIEALVRDLLVFSKPSAPVKRECDLRDILKNLADLMSAELMRRYVDVTLECDGASPANVDPNQISQALLNIVMNATDAMPKGGRLKLAAKREGGEIVVTIADTGIGIAPEKLTHIFDPFFTEKDEGTGLGLAITHSLVEKNGGRIDVRSAPGRGTTFTLRFPAHS